MDLNRRQLDFPPGIMTLKIQYLLLTVFSLLLFSCANHYQKKNGQEIMLYLEKPEARSALIYCSLDGYAGRKLQQKGGIWEVSLPAGKTFRYFYKIDGQIFLPPCPKKEKDDFGSENCIFDPEL